MTIPEQKDLTKGDLNMHVADAVRMVEVGDYTVAEWCLQEALLKLKQLQQLTNQNKEQK